MNTNALRANLLKLNDLLTFEDRRALLREVGMGSPEMVAYLTGQRVPSAPRIQQIGRFFGLPQVNLRQALSDEAAMAARLALTRLRKQRRTSGAPLLHVANG